MTAPTTTARPSGFLTAFLGGSALLVVLVLVQAAMAGQALFEQFDIKVHGYVGNATFTVSVLVFGIALFGRLPRALTIVSALVLVGTFCQTGLGYVGREETVAASVHIPLGVTIFGLVLVQTTLAFLERQRRQG